MKRLNAFKRLLEAGSQHKGDIFLKKYAILVEIDLLSTKIFSKNTFEDHRRHTVRNLFNHVNFHWSFSTETLKVVDCFTHRTLRNFDEALKFALVESWRHRFSALSPILARFVKQNTAASKIKSEILN